jgi:hypothetical protein
MVMKITSENYEKRMYEATDKDGNKFLCWPNAGKLCVIIPEGGGIRPFSDFVSVEETDRHPLDEIK